MKYIQNVILNYKNSREVKRSNTYVIKSWLYNGETTLHYYFEEFSLLFLGILIPKK